MNRTQALLFVETELKKMYPDATISNTGRYITMTDESQDEEELESINAILTYEAMDHAEPMKADCVEGVHFRIGYDLPL